jgi:hypothetical protein
MEGYFSTGQSPQRAVVPVEKKMHFIPVRSPYSHPRIKQAQTPQLSAYLGTLDDGQSPETEQS